MHVNLSPGCYVVAVSGGVDSVVLLDLLAQRIRTEQTQPQSYKLVIAHFDHNIRIDSGSDRQFVQKLAEKYDLPFVYEQAKSGVLASEESARIARYEFLSRVRQDNKAESVITAHHRDDVLETVILNLSRGTGRKGLTSLSSSNTIRRPLLEFPKADIISYANQQGLEWREDSTNIDQHYRRNYIRHTVMPRLDAQARAKLSRLIEKQRSLNQEIDQQIVNQLHLQDRAGVIKRRYFNRLPHTVSKEVLATWLREQGLRSFDSQMLERLAVTAKTAKPGKRLEVFGGHYILVGKEDLALDTQER